MIDNHPIERMTAQTVDDMIRRFDMKGRVSRPRPNSIGSNIDIYDVTTGEHFEYRYKKFSTNLCCDVSGWNELVNLCTFHNLIVTQKDETQIELIGLNSPETDRAFGIVIAFIKTLRRRPMR